MESVIKLDSLVSKRIRMDYSFLEGNRIFYCWEFVLNDSLNKIEVIHEGNSAEIAVNGFLVYETSKCLVK